MHMVWDHPSITLYTTVNLQKTLKAQQLQAPRLCWDKDYPLTTDV